MSKRGKPAVFLDRDGVITALVPDPGTGTHESPYGPEDVEILSGVPAALERLRDAGLTLAVTSNQPASAKGLATNAALDAVHQRTIELLGPHANTISEWRYCRHHPDAAEPALRNCECRKPKPGMLMDAAESQGIDLERSWMIGDADRDLQAGATASCRTILIENALSAGRRAGAIEPDLRANDLATAAVALLRAGR